MFFVYVLRFFSGCELLKEIGVTDYVFAEFTKLAALNYDAAASLVVELFLKLEHINRPSCWMDKAIRDQLRKCGAPRMGLNAE